MLLLWFCLSEFFVVVLQLELFALRFTGVHCIAIVVVVVLLLRLHRLAGTDCQ